MSEMAPVVPLRQTPYEALWAACDEFHEWYESNAALRRPEAVAHFWSRKAEQPPPCVEAKLWRDMIDVKVTSLLNEPEFDVGRLQAAVAAEWVAAANEMAGIARRVRVLRPSRNERWEASLTRLRRAAAELAAEIDRQLGVQTVGCGND